MSDKVAGIILPCFLSAILSCVAWIANSLQDISKSMVVVVYQVNEHAVYLKDHSLLLKDCDARVTVLEHWRQEFLNPTPKYRR